MCDSSLSYSSQIYTATPLVFTRMYRALASVSPSPANGVAVERNSEVDT